MARVAREREREKKREKEEDGRSRGGSYRKEDQPALSVGDTRHKMLPFFSTVSVLSLSGFFLVNPKVLWLVTTNKSVRREILSFCAGRRGFCSSLAGQVICVHFRVNRGTTKT